MGMVDCLKKWLYYASSYIHTLTMVLSSFFPIQRWILLPYTFNLDWRLLGPRECGISDSVQIPSLGFKRIMIICFVAVAKFWLYSVWANMLGDKTLCWRNDLPSWLEVPKASSAQKNQSFEVSLNCWSTES